MKGFEISGKYEDNLKTKVQQTINAVSQITQNKTELTRMCLDKAVPQCMSRITDMALGHMTFSNQTMGVELPNTGVEQTETCPHIDKDEQTVSKPQEEESKDEKIPTKVEKHCKDDDDIPNLPSGPLQGPEDQDKELFE